MDQRQAMDTRAKQHIATLKALPQDSFLAALEAGLQHLSEKRISKERPSWYTLEGPKETEEAVLAMCGILEMIGQPCGTSKEGLTTLLTSSGLQEDRTRLLLAQHGRLVELASVRKVNDASLEDLMDIQWKLGVVASSSEKGDAGRTFVQVSFISQTPGGTKRSARLVEMSLEKFYDFLHQLEKCRASLEHSNLL